MIDVRGLSCPEPVIMVQKAMALGDSEYTVQSDSKTAVENIDCGTLTACSTLA